MPSAVLIGLADMLHPPSKMHTTSVSCRQSRVPSRSASTSSFAARIFTSLLLSAAGAVAAPSLILHHGRIVTVDERFSVMEAIAVTGDRVSAVGRNEDILSLKDGATELVDLKAGSAGDRHFPTASPLLPTE
jgi:hypothetical protein